MPDPASSHIVFLLDRTGSMEVIRDDTIGGFNAFLAEQKKQPGRCTFTLVQFDTQDPQEVVYDRVAMPSVAPLTAETFVPRGGTPLLDSLAQLIVSTGQRLAEMPEPDRPGKVIFVVLTDGQENSSIQYTRAKVFDMITHQREVYQWQFVFLGANQDAIAEAVALGMDGGKAMRFAVTRRGSAAAFKSSARMLRDLRVAPDAVAMNRVAFMPEERLEQDQELASEGKAQA